MQGCGECDQWVLWLGFRCSVRLVRVVDPGIETIENCSLPASVPLVGVQFSWCEL